MKNIKIASIIADFNENYTNKIEKLLNDKIDSINNDSSNYSIINNIYKVPGAIEIPHTAKMICQYCDYDIIIALGVVIKGETDHYQWVCHQVSSGCQDVSLSMNKSIIFGVLTCFNEKQVDKRLNGDNNLIYQYVDSAVKMFDLKNYLQTRQ